MSAANLAEEDYVTPQREIANWQGNFLREFSRHHGGAVQSQAITLGRLVRYASGAWVEITSDGTTERVRWCEGPDSGTEERAWTRSTWWAEHPPFDAHVWPHEANAGAITEEQARETPCQEHGGSLSDCGCPPLSELLNTDMDFSVEAGAFGTDHPASTEGLPTQAAEPPTQQGEPPTQEEEPPTQEHPTVGAWVVRCGGCNHHRVVQRLSPPEPVCPDCGEELELDQWPRLVISPKARECLDKCDGVVRIVKRKSASILCEICLQPGWTKGQRYFSRSEDDARRMHALCVEVAALT